jgi:Tol biopolymer transport system component
MKYALLLLLLWMAACAPGAGSLPTAIDLTALNAASATTAALRSTDAPQATASRPTLPATWTPAPSLSSSDQATPTSSTAVMATSAASGTLYFIFGGLGIARLEVGSGITELISEVGLEPRDLVLAPDGSRLAFTGLASGNAREVYVINLDGSGLRQVSCLGFGRALLPRWSPDSQTLAFGASQVLDGPPGLYTARADGRCPEANGQRQRTQLTTNDLFGLAWSNDGKMLFIGQGIISRLRLNDNALQPITRISGYGPDFSPAPRPGSDRLFYLKTGYDVPTNRRGGIIYQLDASAAAPTELAGAELYASRLAWSRDGRFLLIESVNTVWVQDQNTASTVPVVEDNSFAASAVFNPEGDLLAFVGAAPDNPSVPQVFIISRSGRERTQVSFHQDGSITDLNWGSR